MCQRQPGHTLAAIVAADVAGYSRLMGLDEVGAKSTVDGVAVEFPSVVDAVECAVAVPETPSRRYACLRMAFRFYGGMRAIVT